MSRRRQQRQRSMMTGSVTKPCPPTENVGDAETSSHQSLPCWNSSDNDGTETASPTGKSLSSPRIAGAKSVSPADKATVEDSPSSCRRASSHASTSSTAQSTDEEGSSSSDEGTVVDSGGSDSEIVTTQAETEESKDEPLEGAKLVMALTHILVYLVAQGGATQRSTSFHASRAPHLGLSDYLLRISEYFECSHECYVVALVYMDRVLKAHPDFVLNNLSVHRFLLASMVVASKFQDDAHHANTYYARIGGISPKSLNHMEQELLQLIGWQLYISTDEYDQYYKLLQLQL